MYQTRKNDYNNAASLAMRVLGTECPFWKWLESAESEKFKNQTKTQRNPRGILNSKYKEKLQKFSKEKKKGYLKEQKINLPSYLYQQVIIEKG